MRLKKELRLLVLVLMIALACILPVPIISYKKDNLPKDLIEQVENKESKDDDDDLKEIL